MNILVVIPARGGSKGVPDKNIRLLSGKPLIAWTIEQAVNSKQIDRVIVSTDSNKIAEVSREYGAETPFMRPDELANDTASTESAMEHALKWLKFNEDYHPDAIVLLQCTSPVRNTDAIDNAVKQFYKEKADSLLSVCPFWHFLWVSESGKPKALYDFNNRPRLVGGIDEKSTEIILEVYKHVFPVELIKMPDCKTANAVKLTTNVFRDINIAFINELALMFEKLGIDTMKVLDAAKKKYNFQVHYPGSGVGGPCLPINSYQLLNSARRVGVKLSMIESARKINENMSDHVVKLTSSAFKESNNSLQNSDILILGVSYKPNVKDIQLSPAEKIISKLQNLGTNVHIYDPYFSSDTVFGIKVEDNLDDILPKMDAAIIVTDHDDFKNIKISSFTKMKNPILIDTRGIIDPSSAKLEKVIFRGLGRGNF